MKNTCRFLDSRLYEVILTSASLFLASLFSASQISALPFFASSIFAAEMPERVDAEGVQAVYGAIRDQVASAVVRLETIGGTERVGDVNAIRETTGLLVTADGFLFSSAVAFAHEPDAVVALLASGERRNAKIICTDLKRKITLLKIDMPTETGKDSASHSTSIPSSDSSSDQNSDSGSVPSSGQNSDSSSVPSSASGSSMNSFSVPVAASVREICVGQKVLALGRVLNPETVSIATGIVSGKNRQHGLAIQTDAHVSPDNYGGPLVNLDGKVLGILTPFGMGENELFTGVELYDSGTAFAIPLEDLLTLLPRMKSTTENNSENNSESSTEKKAESKTPVLRPAPKVGLMFRNPTAILATTEILYVAEKSPAEKAGIQAGDIITHVNGKPISRAVDFQQAHARYYEGETLTLTISRNNATQEVKILLKD
ncbi:MAG: PDZ domain-containing protein [Planctomycetia bacterium]|nr:PDZ domain-containing protein [Planctomycetia bacterium]